MSIFAETEGAPALDLLFPDGGPKTEKESRLMFIRNGSWLGPVPLIYQKTTRPLLPNPAAFDRALAVVRADVTTHGLVCFGPTGQGKSRAAYLAARLAMQHHGDRLTILSGRQLRDKATTLGRSGGFSEWVLETVEATDVLVVDDIGHGSASDSYLSAVLELLEEATSSFCYLILTTNYAGRQLLNHWARTAPDSKETAAAIVRRIAEFCAPVNFGPEPKPKTATVPGSGVCRSDPCGSLAPHL